MHVHFGTFLCVYVSQFTFVPFACIHGYESATVFNVHAWVLTCTCMGERRCTWVVRACKADTRVFRGLNFGPLGYTLEGGQFSSHCLPGPLYNDWDGRSCLLALLCNFETREMTSKKNDNLSCVLWVTPSSRVTPSGSISCLFLGTDLKP